jgi:hypothetical protein
MANQSVGNGALFKNDKQGVDTRPDYTGTAKIWDKEFFLSAWIKKSQSGKTYMSLSFKVNEKGSQTQSGQATAQPAGQPADQAPAASAPVDDDIPF